MNSREVIQKLRDAGWELDRIKGDHHHFKHPTRKGLVTVVHPKKDLHIALIKSIEKQSGVTLS